MEAQRLGLVSRFLGPGCCVFSGSLEDEGVAHGCREVLQHENR